jgi:hypothetical protein
MKKFSRQQIKDMNTNKKLPKPPQEAYPLFAEILHDFETSIQPTKKRKIQDLTEFEMETNDLQDGHIHHFDSEITVHLVTPPSTPGQQDHEDFVDHQSHHKLSEVKNKCSIEESPPLYKSKFF